MRTLVGALCLLVATCSVLGQDKGKEPGKKATPLPVAKMSPEQKQRALKVSCNKEAQSLELKGEARKKFLEGCLNESPPSTDGKGKKP